MKSTGCSVSLNTAAALVQSDGLLIVSIANILENAVHFPIADWDHANIDYPNKDFPNVHQHVHSADADRFVLYRLVGRWPVLIRR
jgi:hypothetical protein